MVGGGKTFIDEINSLVRDRFQRVFQKGHQDRVASLGQHPLECLVCGASADLREKFDPIRRDDSEIPLWDAQSLEIPQFVEVGKNFFWGIRNGTAPQPGERGSIRLWTLPSAGGRVEEEGSRAKSIPGDDRFPDARLRVRRPPGVPEPSPPSRTIDWDLR